MGMTISCDERAPIPRDTALELVCDSCPPGMFGATRARFAYGHHILNHRAAMIAGWLERNASDGRAWLCPFCSGKISKNVSGQNVA